MEDRHFFFIHEREEGSILKELMAVVGCFVLQKILKIAFTNLSDQQVVRGLQAIVKFRRLHSSSEGYILGGL